MFNLRDFIYSGLVDAIGKLNDYQVILNAAGWLDKGVLIEEDLVIIQSLIDAHNKQVEEEIKALEEANALPEDETVVEE